MNNKNKNSIEHEFRTSQVFKTLTESGGNIANAIADGIGKATGAIDHAVNGVVSGVNNAAQQNGRPTGTSYTNTNRQQNNQTGTPGGPPPQNGGAVPPGVKYNYQSQYTRPPVAPPPPRKHNKVPPPGQFHRGNTAYAAPAPQRPQAAARQPGMPMAANPNMKMVREPSVAKYWITGIAAFVYALFGKLYEPSHFIVFALVLVGVFALSSILFKGKKKYIAVPKEEPKPEPVSKTGNPEVDKIVEDGNRYIAKMRQANDAIPDTDLSECIDRMEQSSKAIFDYISKNPDKAPQIRKFMNYYLPTTMKLLESYQRLDSQVVKGENISGTMEDIERMLYTIAGAFEKQLDALFSEEAMDISTDISVFESMLKQEGFVSPEDEKNESATKNTL